MLSVTRLVEGRATSSSALLMWHLLCPWLVCLITPCLSGNSNLLPDDNSSTLAGTLNGRIKVYVDPYSANVSDAHFYVAGYKGSSAYDAGLFYCPYVPLQMVVLWVLTPSNLRLDLRLATAWSLIPSLRSYSGSRRTYRQRQPLLQTC